MRVLLFVAALISSSFAFASACEVKMTNAASYELAQKHAVRVQSVVVAKYEPGVWTEMPALNFGSGEVFVTVEVNGKTNGDLYRVNVKQIGSTTDCEVTSVERLDRAFF